MPKSFESSTEMFLFVSEEGVGSTHSQGYFWLWQELMPALEKAAFSRQVPAELIADCYYVIGDVHDFNNAPKSAIHCYREALKFDPTMGAAHREIANMLGRMGDYDEAITHSDKALALSPVDSHAISDRSDYFGDTKLPPPKIFDQPNALWVAYEHLAQNDPASALGILNRKKGGEFERARLHCYGAMRKANQYLASWKEISTSLSEISFTEADWFFMEDSVYLEPDLWEILFASEAIFSGVFTIFDGLDESKRYCSLSSHESIRLRLEYYVYAQSGDFDGLRHLNKLYPEWTELREALQKNQG